MVASFIASKKRAGKCSCFFSRSARRKISQKKGGSYSNVRLDLDSLFSADGRFIETPSNVIFEVKFPNSDCRGAVK